MAWSEKPGHVPGFCFGANGPLIHDCSALLARRCCAAAQFDNIVSLGENFIRHLLNCRRAWGISVYVRQGVHRIRAKSRHVSFWDGAALRTINNRI
jgi:hypothetical protein